MPSSARLHHALQAVKLLLFLSALPASAQNAVHQEFFMTSDQVKLHYLEAGQGKAVLFVPGWLMPADIWEEQIQELSKNYHVIALDPRSQGKSDMTPNGNDPLRRSQDISELLDHLQLNSIALVGWSLGAFDCLAYLRQFGVGRLNALVLVDSPLAASAGSKPSPRGNFLKLFASDRVNANSNYIWGLFKMTPSKGFAKKMIAAAALIPTDIALSVLDNTQPADAWVPGIPVLRLVPLLYIVTPKFATQAAYLQEVDPQARVEIFEAAGHALFVDEPERFDILVNDFLRQSSLYPAGLPHGKPKTLAPVPSPLPATLPMDTPTPTALIVITSTPVLTAMAAATVTPTDTYTIGMTPVLTPTATEVITAAPNGGATETRYPKPPDKSAQETPPIPPSFSSRLSRKWKSIWNGTETPTPQATAPPSSRPRPAVRGGETENPIESNYFTTSDHVKLHYLEAGQGMALVFIPGWLLPAEIWKEQLEGLSEDYHVIALDPRSQGRSDMTPAGDEPIRQAKDIQELLDHLQLTSVVLVGWSHGGFQVLAYLGQYGTDRLYATVLVDSALAAASSAAATGPRIKFLNQFQNNRANATRGFVWSLFKKHPPKGFFHELIEAAGRTPTDIALALMNNAFPGETYQPSLPTIRQVPLLYAVNPKYTFQANYLKQVYPGARVEIFVNSGHALFYDEADHFNGLMRDFLKQAALYPPGLPSTHGPAKAGAPARSFLENPK